MMKRVLILSILLLTGCAHGWPVQLVSQAAFQGHCPGAIGTVRGAPMASCTVIGDNGIDEYRTTRN